MTDQIREIERYPRNAVVMASAPWYLGGDSNVSPIYLLEPKCRLTFRTAENHD